MAEKCCCGNGKKSKNVLLFACSGAANVGEAADQACRQLMWEEVGAMSCAVGVGANFDKIVQNARNADLNLVIDGCDNICGRKIFEKLSIPKTTFLRVTDMGIEKKPKGARATAIDINTVVAKAKLHIAVA